MDLISILKQSSIFTGLDDEAIRKFSEIGEIKSYKEHENIFVQGEASHELYVVLSGEVVILLEAEEKIVKPKNIATIKPGETFGEIAILTKELRSATAKASERDTSLFVCKRSQFKSFCMTNTEVGLQIIFNISKKISSMVSTSNRVIIDSYVSNNIALLFREFIVTTDLEKTLLIPRERDFEISEKDNFLIATRAQFLNKKVSTEYLKISLFAENEVLKKLLVVDETDLEQTISAMLTSIRTSRSYQDSLLIKKGNEKIHLDWQIKGSFLKEGELTSYIHVYVYLESFLPNKAVQDFLDFTNMPIQHETLRYLKQTKQTTDASILIIHHRTLEIANTLQSIKQLGFNIEAFIGIPYGNVDKLVARILDYVTGGHYYSLQMISHADKKAEFTFDFDFSSFMSTKDEHEIRELLEKLEDKGYLQSMTALTGYFFKKSLVKCLNKGKKLIVLEDGGYIYPMVLEALANKQHPLHELMKRAIELKLFMGIVEGTASGEVRSLKAFNEASDDVKALVPFMSGARDSIKTMFESKGIGYSILETSQIALKSIGCETFEKRKIAIIGGYGVIGTRLLEQLSTMQNSLDNIYSIDKVASPYDFQVNPEYKLLRDHVVYPKKPFKTFDSIKTAILSGINTIIGTTGASIFSENDLDTFITRHSSSTIDEITLISGSSKDVEFKKANILLNSLLLTEETLSDQKIIELLDYFKSLESLEIFSDDQLFTDEPFSRQYFTTFRSKLLTNLRVKKQIYPDVGSVFYIEYKHHKKRIVLLADGLVINFFAPYAHGASMEYMDPILTLQILGLVRLLENPMKGGFYRITDELKEEDNEALWETLESQLS